MTAAVAEQPIKRRSYDDDAASSQSMSSEGNTIKSSQRIQW
jgi:hypothetical protein